MQLIIVNPACLVRKFIADWPHVVRAILTRKPVYLGPKKVQERQLKTKYC